MISRVEVARHRLTHGWFVRRLTVAGVTVEGRLTVFGAPIVDLHPGSSVVLHDGVVLVSRSQWTALGVSRPTIIRTMAPAAEISVGAESGLSGTTLCAAVGITLGARVLCGADVVIADTDFHPVDTVPRVGLPTPAGKPQDAILIGDDVFLGARSLVLKGVAIGAGTVVGAGSVVTSSLPAGVVAGGNPARVIRHLGPRPHPPVSDG